MLQGSSGGSLEALLGACARDDPVAVSEAQPGPEEPVLVPEVGEPLVELLQLGGDVGVASLSERAPELGSAPAQPVDLIVNLAEGGHVPQNVEWISAIPSRR